MRDDRRYLLARLLQFFAPGVPQVYYVGLLAGANDTELLARTGVGRDVNRRHYTDAEVAEALGRPVVRALARLIRFRNAHGAFAGEMTCLETEPGTVAIRWRAGEHVARLSADLVRASYTLRYTTADGERRVDHVADLPF